MSVATTPRRPDADAGADASAQVTGCFPIPARTALDTNTLTPTTAHTPFGCFCPGHHILSFFVVFNARWAGTNHVPAFLLLFVFSVQLIEIPNLPDICSTCLFTRLIRPCNCLYRHWFTPRVLLPSCFLSPFWGSNPQVAPTVCGIGCIHLCCETDHWGLVYTTIWVLTRFHCHLSAVLIGGPRCLHLRIVLSTRPIIGFCYAPRCTLAPKQCCCQRYVQAIHCLVLSPAAHMGLKSFYPRRHAVAMPHPLLGLLHQLIPTMPPR